MDNETIEPVEPTTADPLIEQPTFLTDIASSESPKDLAAIVACHLVGIGPRILTMSEQPKEWPVFLDHLLTTLRREPGPTYYDPL